MENKNNSKLLFRTFIHFLKSFYLSRPWTSLFLTLTLTLGRLNGVVNIYLFKYIIDSLGSVDRGSVWFVIILLIYGGSQTIWTYLRELSELLKVEIRDSLTTRLQEEFMKKLESVPFVIFENDKVLDEIEKIKDWIDWKPSSQFFPSVAIIIPLIVKILVASFVIVNIGYLPILILIAFSIPQFIANNKIGDNNYTITDTRSPFVRVYNYLTYLNIEVNSKKEIRLYNSFPRLWAKIKKIMDEFARFNWKNSLENFWIANLGETIQIVGQLIVIYFFVIIPSGNLSIGTIILNISFVSLFTTSIIDLLQEVSLIRACLVFFADYIKLLDVPDEVRGNENTESKFENLEFVDVSFKYENSDKYVFQNLNLQFNKGDKIAMVGLNGSGKTTLIKLLLRFYTPTSGKILLNGIDISTIELNTYLDFFSAIFQDFTKYAFTARENIEFGNPAVIDEELYSISKYQADADEVINGLMKKDDQNLTKIFEGGTELSGGQWQRIALARMYYRNADILILDEPTSAIDAIAEAKIFKRVHEVSKEKTVLIISHRFSTVREADRIIVLSEGKIIEDGNHLELLSNNGLYSEMFNAQAEGYK